MDDIFQTLGHIGKLFQYYAYPFEDGCAKNIAYESHKRGKNWLATVCPNRAAPGGLDRVFWRGSGPWYKAPPTFYRGDVVEMGGDYYSARGNVSRDRRYVLVVRIENQFFIGVHIGDTAPSKSAVEHEQARFTPPYNYYSVSVKRGKRGIVYDVVIVRSHGAMSDIQTAAVASDRRLQGMEYIGSDIGPDARASVRGLSVYAEVKDGVWIEESAQ